MPRNRRRLVLPTEQGSLGPLLRCHKVAAWMMRVVVATPGRRTEEVRGGAGAVTLDTFWTQMMSGKAQGSMGTKGELKISPAQVGL